MKLVWLSILFAAVALAKVTVVTERITVIDYEAGTTNYVWIYEASLASQRQPVPGEYRSSLTSTSSVVDAVRGEIQTDVAKFFGVTIAEVEVLP